METKVTLTIEHPEDAPINWFMPYVLNQYLKDITADMEDGWSIRIADSDE